jgi:hypothetical protein
MLGGAVGSLTLAAAVFAVVLAGGVIGLVLTLGPPQVFVSRRARHTRFHHRGRDPENLATFETWEVARNLPPAVLGSRAIWRMTLDSIRPSIRRGIWRWR